MKNLTLLTGRAMTCLILLCLILMQSCRKDALPAKVELPDASLQYIKEETILKWIQTNPSAKILTLNWAKAMQAKVDGKNVVRVPTLNVDKISMFKNSSLKANILASNGASSTNSDGKPKLGINANFSNEHPPELFFIQEDENAPLKTYLLNFVPKDKNVDFGQNGLWTGKLYEWNLNGDTVAIQELEKSVLKVGYLLKYGNNQNDNLSASLKTNKLQSLKGIKEKQISGFWGWFSDLLADGVGWVGSLLGLSGDYRNTSLDGWRLEVDWHSVFSGDPGNSGNGPDNYQSAGLKIYSAYASGYSGVAGGPNVGGGGSGGGYTSYHPSKALIELNPNDYIVSTLGITDVATVDFLYANLDIQITLSMWLDAHEHTPEASEFVRWAIRYLMENPNIDFSEFKAENLDYTLNPPNFDDVLIINNGIEIEDAPAIIPNGPKPVIGSTTNRNNTEDLTYGTNHDATGVNPSMLGKSDATLFISMNDLMDFGTVKDGQLRQVAHEFVNLFKTNTSPNTVATNPILNQKVEISGVFANFTKKFGARLQTKLRETNGDINGMSIQMEDVHPKFGGYYNMVAGLTILLNDTEQTTIRLESYDPLPNGKFIAVIEVTIMDHFGLDKNDVVSKQHMHDGFSAWWILQHNRGYVPFQTKVVSRKTIIGYYK